MNISELVIYRNLKHEDLFEDMAGLMGLGKEGQKADPFACARLSTSCRSSVERV